MVIMPAPQYVIRVRATPHAANIPSVLSLPTLLLYNVQRSVINMSTAFDVIEARSHFPALQQDHQVYFDNAGGSQVLSTVASSYG